MKAIVKAIYSVADNLPANLLPSIKEVNKSIVEQKNFSFHSSQSEDEIDKGITVVADWNYGKFPGKPEEHIWNLELIGYHLNWLSMEFPDSLLPWPVLGSFPAAKWGLYIEGKFYIFDPTKGDAIRNFVVCDRGRQRVSVSMTVDQQKNEEDIVFFATNVKLVRQVISATKAAQGLIQTYTEVISDTLPDESDRLISKSLQQLLNDIASFLPVSEIYSLP